MYTSTLCCLEEKWFPHVFEYTKWKQVRSIFPSILNYQPEVCDLPFIHPSVMIKEANNRFITAINRSIVIRLGFVTLCYALIARVKMQIFRCCWWCIIHSWHRGVLCVFVTTYLIWIQYVYVCIFDDHGIIIMFIIYVILSLITHFSLYVHCFS